METAFDAVILANGLFPTHPVPLDILRRASHIVACDGAAAALFRTEGLRQDCEVDIVGDGDSVPEELRDRLIRVDEQADNDLTKATRHLIGRLRPADSPAAEATATAGTASAPLHIAYLGCTGLREDHTLGNISLLMRYRRDFGIRPTMFTDQGFFTTAGGSQRFASFPGQQVSIFNFGSTRLTAEGLKWDAYAYREWWQGTLNEALAGSFTLHADGPYLVFQTYLPKG